MAALVPLAALRTVCRRPCAPATLHVGAHPYNSRIYPCLAPYHGHTACCAPLLCRLSADTSADTSTRVCGSCATQRTAHLAANSLLSRPTCTARVATARRGRAQAAGPSPRPVLCPCSLCPWILPRAHAPKRQASIHHYSLSLSLSLTVGEAADGKGATGQNGRERKRERDRRVIKGSGHTAPALATAAICSLSKVRAVCLGIRHCVCVHGAWELWMGYVWCCRGLAA